MLSCACGFNGFKYLSLYKNHILHSEIATNVLILLVLLLFFVAGACIISLGDSTLKLITAKRATMAFTTFITLM